MQRIYQFILIIILLLLLVFDIFTNKPELFPSSRISPCYTESSPTSGKLESNAEKSEKLINVPSTLDLSNKSYFIDGFDRFDWYQFQLFRKTNDRPKTASNISTLYAYEFEHEITVTTTSWKRMGHRVYCRYLDDNNIEIGIPFESLTYPEYIVSCKKRDGTKKIGLSVEKNGDFFPLPIIDRMLKKPKYELSMCVASIYGDEPKWLMFIEMIEHFKLQGVQHFYLHIHHASEYDMRVINDYVRTGEVEVHYLIERDMRADNHWHMVNLADCLIWSRGETKWTIFADLDERIYMTNYTGTILDYVQVVKNESIASIQFRQQWIMKTELMPPKYEGDRQLDKWMPTHRWHSSSGIGPPGHTAKCIVDTSKVFIMFIHYVTQFFPATNGSNYVQIRVDPEEGLVRHYRDLSLGDWGRKWLNSTLKFGALRDTDYPSAFLGKLTENVKRRAKYVYDNYYD
ncbi:Glycosyltransferase family 92 protein [Caenorhabditis elegans]|uniref:Glycosyltransferase family 92 protein n=1 Tax=Caenorhabditis elegans TaxID=6239 RepID=Q22213_CAEEL|nr:Glycosyltransferase family 92 protein [Caenorhabditis elegans]CCD65787.2 Glycosyltransferase family 92 protein [Caenorhabditis elegans]|eukprot:NP_505002.2 Uncharacterized protein CELE_T05B11.4 [Caenorhabditis elegans]